MTDEDVVQRLRAVLGRGTVKPRTPKPEYKTLYRWRVGEYQDVLYVLDRIQPWLGERRGNKALAARERILKNRKTINGTKGN